MKCSSRSPTASSLGGMAMDARAALTAMAKRVVDVANYLVGF